MQKWFTSDEVQWYLQYWYVVEIKGFMPIYPQVYLKIDEIL